ncbi:MAG: divergent PAP2 family protein [Candidatus Krumholzibacteriia bacterium]
MVAAALATHSWPIWLLVVACGFAVQVVKVVAYSAAERRLQLTLLTRSTGLPSLPAAALTCLAVLLGLRDGWSASTTAAAVVFTTIVVHDGMRLRGVAEEQRRAVHRLVSNLPGDERFQQRVLGYLDPRAHHLGHVVVGVVFGALFALALGIGGG